MYINISSFEPIRISNMSSDTKSYSYLLLLFILPTELRLNWQIRLLISQHKHILQPNIRPGHYTPSSTEWWSSYTIALFFGTQTFQLRKTPIGNRESNEPKCWMWYRIDVVCGNIGYFAARGTQVCVLCKWRSYSLNTIWKSKRSIVVQAMHIAKMHSLHLYGVCGIRLCQGNRIWGIGKCKTSRMDDWWRKWCLNFYIWFCRYLRNIKIHCCLCS